MNFSTYKNTVPSLICLLMCSLIFAGCIDRTKFLGIDLESAEVRTENLQLDTKILHDDSSTKVSIQILYLGLDKPQEVIDQERELGDGWEVQYHWNHLISENESIEITYNGVTKTAEKSIYVGPQARIGLPTPPPPEPETTITTFIATFSDVPSVAGDTFQVALIRDYGESVGFESAHNTFVTLPDEFSSFSVPQGNTYLASEIIAVPWLDDTSISAYLSIDWSCEQVGGEITEYQGKSDFMTLSKDEPLLIILPNKLQSLEDDYSHQLTGNCDAVFDLSQGGYIVGTTIPDPAIHSASIRANKTWEGSFVVVPE